MQTRPLSPFNYYRGNKKRTIPVIVCTSLCIFFTYVLSIYVQATFMSDDLTNGNEKYFSYVYSQKSSEKLDSAVIEKIMSFEDTERIVQCSREFTNFNMPIGGDAMMPIYKVSEEDMKFMIDTMGLKFKEGGFPGKEDEIALPERIAKSKSYKVGDIVGKSYKKGETLNGSYKLTGILQGDSLMGFIPYNGINREPKSMVLVFHKKDKVYEENDFLINNIKSQNTSVMTYRQLKQRQSSDNMQMQVVINILLVIVVVVMILAIVNLSYVHFFQRRREFGVLHAVGYSRRQIVKRAFVEMFVMQSLGYAIGIIMALGAGILLKTLLFDRKGLPFEVINLQAFVQTIIIPIFMSVFNIIPVSRMLAKIDAISIIQRNE
ncbi:MAG: ABC transporter permease [Bacillota bacterium]|nr:ABC transporter permease [Bacillota bacterium]